MWRTLLGSVIRTARYSSNALVCYAPKQNFCLFGANSSFYPATTFLKHIPTSIPAPENLLQVKFSAKVGLLNSTPTRSVTKFSLVKGKRKSVKAVLKRFKRLHWGGWIRTHSGRHKKLFKKTPALRRRLKQHIFTNATQSWLLDKMVTSFWRRPKYYIDDPYLPYHSRDEYFATKGKTFKV